MRFVSEMVWMSSRNLFGWKNHPLIRCNFKIKVHNLSINSPPPFLPLWPLLEMYFIVLPTCFSSDICRRNTLSFGCDYILKNNLIWNCLFLEWSYIRWWRHRDDPNVLFLKYQDLIRVRLCITVFYKIPFSHLFRNNQIKVGWYQIV